MDVASPVRRGRRVRVRVVAGLVALVLVGAGLWLVVTRTGEAARWRAMEQVPGVLSAGDVGDGARRVLLAPGVEVDEIERAARELAEVRTGDFPSVALGIAGSTADRSYPDRRVFVPPPEAAGGGSSERLARMLAVVSRLPAEVTEAEGYLRSSDGTPYVDLRASAPLDETLTALVGAVDEVPGSAPVLDATDVHTTRPDGTGTYFLRCSGPDAARRLADRFAAVGGPGEVVGGEGGCGPGLRVELATPASDRVAAILAARRALGPGPSIEVGGGTEPRVISPDREPAGDLAEVLDDLERAGAVVEEVTADLSLVQLGAEYSPAVLRPVLALLGDRPGGRRTVVQLGGDIAAPLAVLVPLVPQVAAVAELGYTQTLEVPAGTTTPVITVGPARAGSEPVEQVADRRVVAALRAGDWDGRATLTVADAGGAGVEFRATSTGTASRVRVPPWSSDDSMRGLVAVWDASARLP